MSYNKTTEADSNYDHLEEMSVEELLISINKEDKTVAGSVQKSLKKIETLIDAVQQKMSTGGRLFYIGAGTSGRLGILDASECPPTFGVDANRVIGLISGGDKAIRKSVEFAEDDTEQGWLDLLKFNVSENDIVVGIAASGTTPYVVGALKKCEQHKIVTGCITCNFKSPLAQTSQYPVEIEVGPEFVTGSTRMKAGTAQKMVLNMISTTVMIRLGRVIGNKMVDMQLSNKKLVTRGIKMLMKDKGLTAKEAIIALNKSGSVREALKRI